jgi:ribosome-binding protein aMBF1 (putative translation factor)
MIRNEREYKISRAALQKFEKAIAHIAKLRQTSKIEPWKLELQKNATLSMMDDLRIQLREFEKLKAGKFKLSIFDNLESIPTNLIKARISLGWTQKDLARRIGTTEQQIQKYEASNYKTASFQKVTEIVTVFKEEQSHGGQV